MRALALLVVLPLLAAGCVTGPADTAAVEPAPKEAALDDLKALVADLPCEADVGAQTSANLLKLGEWRVEQGDLGEVDVRGDLALLARHQLGGLYVLDLSDPVAPALVSTLEMEETSGLDIKWLPAGNGAIIGDFGAIHVVDLTDLAAPVLASTFAYADAGIGGQAHMVTVREIAGEDWVFVASQTNNMPIYILKREGWNLTYVGSYATVPVLNTLPLGSHDIAILNDTMLDGKPVMYVADGLAGWSAHDVSDPAKPVRLGGTVSLEPGYGYTHTVRVEFHEGKRIVVTMSEVGVNTLKVYDATDLQTPILLARWNADPTRPIIPQHNIQLHQGMLYLAHYTEGLYVFNLTGVIAGPPLLGTLEMDPVAHYAVEEPSDGGALGFANVWDVVLSKGVLWASDLNGTFTSIAFGCVSPGDEGQTAVE
jgi:hypothetical protein